MITTFKLFEQFNNQFIDKSELNHYVKEYCSDFSFNDLPIYRGMMPDRELKDKIFIFDPKEHTRKSRNTNNYYTLMLDNFQSWKNYPKRSKSIICSTHEGTASSYSNGFPYRIIPFNNSMWGVCNSDDLWDSFKYLFNLTHIKLLEQFNNFLNNNYYNFFMSKTKNINSYVELNEENFNILKLQLNNLLDYFKSDTELYKNDIRVKTILSNIKENETFIEFLERALNPVLNDIKLLTYNELKQKKLPNNEVWTNSKCIFVPVNMI